MLTYIPFYQRFSDKLIHVIFSHPQQDILANERIYKLQNKGASDFRTITALKGYYNEVIQSNLYSGIYSEISTWEKTNPPHFET